ncbi:MAG: GFA family protein, partial [Gammaproteobacteria bacterium]|nr:GFA family protein [Gammaproteobacteria bacterium]
EIPGEPMFMNHCQCRDCQHTSGTGHGSYLTFAADGVSLTGESVQWGRAADSGHVKTRGFCPRCGSPVYLRFSAMPQIFTVHAASLDDPSRFVPQAVTYHRRGLPWDVLDPAMPAFDKMPPG